MDRILVIRLSAIGDVIHALPVAYALRQAYPEAELTWLVEKKAYPLLKNNPNLDRVIIFPKDEVKKEFKRNKVKALKKAKSFFKGLKEYNFDLVLDLHGLFKSALNLYFSGARDRYGPKDGRELSTLFYNHKIKLPDKKLHQIDRNLALAQGIGAKTDQVKFNINISKSTEKKIEASLAKLELDKSKRLIVINPFTTWSSKNWVKARWADLTDKLIRRLNCEIIFSGGPADREGVEEIRQMINQKAYNLAAKTNLEELAALYQRADLFIGGDTGPMHLAVAMGLKVIALMGPTTAKTHGPYGDGHLVIQKDIGCKECWKRVCPKEDSCMEAITAQDVFEATKEILERG